MSATLGWDIGGVNTKVARVAGGTVLAVGSRPFELQHDPGALVQVLRELAAETGGSGDDTHAVTMTAELSQMFRTKREGVQFVLDAVVAAFPGATIFVYAVDGRFLTVAEARDAPLLVAAANWACHRAHRRAVPAGRPARRHRHDEHRHHSHRRWRSGGARMDRPRSSCLGRACLLRGGANAG